MSLTRDHRILCLVAEEQMDGTAQFASKRFKSAVGKLADIIYFVYMFTNVYRKAFAKHLLECIFRWNTDWLFFEMTFVLY